MFADKKWPLSLTQDQIAHRVQWLLAATADIELDDAMLILCDGLSEIFRRYEETVQPEAIKEAIKLLYYNLKINTGVIKS